MTKQPRNGTGDFNVVRPDKARRAAKRAVRDTVLSAQIETLGAQNEGTLEAIAARLDGIDRRVRRLERRMLGAGILAIIALEGAPYLLRLIGGE